MAGEAWRALTDLLARIDTQRLHAAEEDWRNFENALMTVGRGLDSHRAQLTDTGLEGEVAKPLIDTTETASRELSRTLDAISGWGSGPHGALSSLSGIITSLRSRTRRDERGGTGLTFPTVRSEDPDMGLLQDWQLGQFDLLAVHYLDELRMAIQDAVRVIDGATFEWSRSVPQADPSADPAALGG